MRVALSLNEAMLTKKLRDAGLQFGLIPGSGHNALAFGAGRFGRFHRFHRR